MPRDGSGNYTLPSPLNPVVTNTIITSTWANTTLADIAAQLNNVFTRDGLLGPTGPFKIVDGTVAAPGLAFNSEPGLGWYREGVGLIGTASGGGRTSLLNTSNGATTALTLFARTNAGRADLVASANPGIFLDKPASGGTVDFYGRMAGKNRWLMRPGNETAETGANAGSDFALFRYDDAGTTPTLAMLINRASGVGTFGGSWQAQKLQIDTNFYMSQDATNYYLNFAPSWFFVYTKSTGNLAWNHGPGGPQTNIQPNGDFIGGGNVYVSGAQIGMISTGTERYLRFANDGWRLRWITANGTLQYLNNSGAQLWAVDASGNSNIPGQFNANTLVAAANASVNGGVVNLGVAGSQITSKAHNIREFDNSGGIIFANVIDANPGGLTEIISMQHQPGSFAHIQFQVGGGIFNFTNSGLAQKNGAGGQWDPVSDARLKTNVRPLEYGLAEVLMLQPVMFDMIDGLPDNVGVIAQDAMVAMPRIAYKAYNSSPEQRALLGEDEGYYLKPDYIQYALVNAVKELTERIRVLETT